MANMQTWVTQVIQGVTAWSGTEQASHRFGGTEFRLGKVEIGHIHRNGMVDIPFTRAIRDILLAEGKAEPHHLLPETGWISFYIRAETDVAAALWLLRVSYLQKARRRMPELTQSPEIELSQSLRLAVLGQ
ncbi:MAG: hypothetical protein OHK0023_09240 [Anaerolineae bacterium]